MKRKTFFSYKCSQLDIAPILGIQTDNISSVLKNEDRYSQGSLRYIVPTKSLLASMRLGLLRAIIRTRNFRVTGFIAGVPIISANHISHLSQALPDINAYFRYPLLFQLCIERQNRKKGLGTSLLSQLIYEAEKQQFEAVVTDVDFDNVPAQKFLEKNYFKKLSCPLVNDRIIFYKNLKTAS